MSEQEKIKPCVFCGSDQIAIFDGSESVCAECGECGALGPFGEDEAAALDTWNRRAGEDTLVEALELALLALSYGTTRTETERAEAVDAIKAALAKAQGKQISNQSGGTK